MVQRWKSGRTSAKIPGKPGWNQPGVCLERGGHRDISSQWDSLTETLLRVFKMLKVPTTQACDYILTNRSQIFPCFPKFPLHLIELNFAYTCSISVFSHWCSRNKKSPNVLSCRWLQQESRAQWPWERISMKPSSFCVCVWRIPTANYNWLLSGSITPNRISRNAQPTWSWSF